MNASVCPKCQRVRILVGSDPHDGLICGSCSGAKVEYLCKKCGKAGFPYAAGVCDRCVLHEELVSKFSDENGFLISQLEPVVRALQTVSRPRHTLQWIRDGKAAQLLIELSRKSSPITHDLLDQLPPGPAVRHIRGVLVCTGVLPEREEYLDYLTPWLERLLQGKPRHHVTLVRPYACWDVLRRARRKAQRQRTFSYGSARSARERILIAFRFLAWLDERGVAFEELKQADVESWLAERPESRRRHGIRYFLGWALRRGVIEGISMPTLPRLEPVNFLDVDEDVQILRRCVEGDDLPLEIRVAGAIVMLFGVTVQRALQLTVGDIEERNGETCLKFGPKAILLPPRLADLVRQLAESRRGRSVVSHAMRVEHHLFPGLVPGKPAHAESFARELNRYGIRLPAVRNTARMALAEELPAAVMADLFGMHINTAVRWVKLAKRDWTGFLAERRTIPHSRNK